MYEATVADLLQSRYAKVSGICCSDTYLFANNNFGYIALFCLKNFLSPEFWLSDSVPSIPTSSIHFRAHISNIKQIFYKSSYLISSCKDYIKFWSEDSIVLNELNGENESKLIEINPKFTLEIPHGTIELVENSGDKLSIWAVLNDGTIGCWNISVDNCAGNQVLQTKNCAELIPALPSRSVTSLIAHGNKVVIGYSDETVRIWQGQQFVYQFDIKNGSTEKTDRQSTRLIQKLGNTPVANRKKITSLAVDGSGDWLIVGTENHYFTVWNLPTITLTNSLPVSGIPSNCIFKGKDILTIGSEEFIYHWSINGKYNMRVSTSSTCLGLLFILNMVFFWFVVILE